MVEMSFEVKEFTGRSRSSTVLNRSVPPGSGTLRATRSDAAAGRLNF
jgi:hypothetical protein